MPMLNELMNGETVKKAKEYWEKIKKKFSRSKDIPQIEIYSWNERPRQTGPHIRIGNVNSHSNGIAVDNDVQGNDIGHGIKVKNQGKPKRCPYCASPARDENNNDIIVPNTSGGGKWYCRACENIF